MQHANYSMKTLADHVGKELGVSDWVQATQAMINNFADCTGDQQWIHVDVARAERESPFGGPVAHGYLTLSLLAKFGMDVGVVPADAVAAFNYGFDKVRFIAPVKAGARVRGHIVLMEATDQGKGRWLLKLKNTVEIEGEDKPALIAESLAVLVGK